MNGRMNKNPLPLLCNSYFSCCVDKSFPDVIDVIFLDVIDFLYFFFFSNLESLQS